MRKHLVVNGCQKAPLRDCIRCIKTSTPAWLYISTIANESVTLLNETDNTAEASESTNNAYGYQKAPHSSSCAILAQLVRTTSSNSVDLHDVQIGEKYNGASICIELVITELLFNKVR